MRFCGNAAITFTVMVFLLPMFDMLYFYLLDVFIIIGQNFQISVDESIDNDE